MPFEQLREKIDRVDSRILELIEERVEIAKKIGVVKRKKGLPIVDQEREQKILSDVTGKTKLDKQFIKKIFREIMEYCRDNE
ncbi:MAG: chorismate mutase [Candidatus Altiarchaeota archaeon]|nr:chorismate mutase [Candidatus Altiarchaeota archaeon]